MATVHDHDAIVTLRQLAKAKMPEFRDVLSKTFPGWQNNAVVDSLGYARLTNSHHHISIRVARMLHDALPDPFGGKAFDWTRCHGFDRVLDYIDWPGRTEQEVDKMIRDAIARCKCVIEN